MQTDLFICARHIRSKALFYFIFKDQEAEFRIRNVSGYFSSSFTFEFWILICRFSANNLQTNHLFKSYLLEPTSGQRPSLYFINQQEATFWVVWNVCNRAWPWCFLTIFFVLWINYATVLIEKPQDGASLIEMMLLGVALSASDYP